MNENAYKWQITFDTGRVEEFSRGQKLDYDKQDPPTDFGLPVRVEMIAKTSEFKNILVNIPKGALPVCLCRPSIQIGGVGGQGLEYRVGYNMIGIRHMVSVNAETGDISLVVDNKGRKSRNG